MDNCDQYQSTFPYNFFTPDFSILFVKHGRSNSILFLLSLSSACSCLSSVWTPNSLNSTPYLGLPPKLVGSILKEYWVWFLRSEQVWKSKLNSLLKSNFLLFYFFYIFFSFFSLLLTSSYSFSGFTFRCEPEFTNLFELIPPYSELSSISSLSESLSTTDDSLSSLAAYLGSFLNLNEELPYRSEDLLLILKVS